MDDLHHNRLLATHSPDDLHLLRPFLEAVELGARQILDAPRATITHVYFVQTGLLSVVGMACPDGRIEVGMVGRLQHDARQRKSRRDWQRAPLGTATADPGATSRRAKCRVRCRSVGWAGRWPARYAGCWQHVRAWRWQPWELLSGSRIVDGD